MLSFRILNSLDKWEEPDLRLAHINFFTSALDDPRFPDSRLGNKAY